VSEEDIASIFRVEKVAKQETNMTLVSCSADSSTLKMEAIYSSETSVGSARHLLSRWFLERLIFYPEDRGEMFLRNVG
jgi:hypothetical protein